MEEEAPPSNEREMSFLSADPFFALEKDAGVAPLDCGGTEFEECCQCEPADPAFCGDG